MFFKFKNHYNLFFLSFLLLISSGCQLQDPNKNHGILFLENRSNKLVLNKSNQNDVIKIIGNPHSKSIDNVDTWLYIDRVLTKGKYHKLGQHILKESNALVLTFDKYGILKDKKFYTKNDMKKMSFSEKETENQLTKKSFIESFLSSVKQKMYGNR